ncbi:MAG: hypothetical protein ACLQU1_08040 [Bryobacteraceae bacterium]
MRKLLPFLGLCVSVIHAGDSIPTQPVSAAPDAVAPAVVSRALVAPAVPSAGKNLWRISLTTLAVSNALDIQSSWGKHELNSTLASPSGNFGAQGALLKLGFQGGLVGIEYLLTRHHPSARLYRTLAIINFGASAGIAGVVAHNYTVAPPGH